MKLNTIFCIIISALCSLPLSAQKETTKGIQWAAARGVEYSIKGGFNIGGTAPLPLPREIRSIDSYNPEMALFLEANVTKWITKRWGVETGVRFETKGMTTKAQVKNYSMELIVSGEPPMVGRWTGGVKTRVNNSFLTVPVLATYKVSPRWKLQAGLFLSFLASGDFSGNVYKGYLRENDPTGNKIEFKDDDEAAYDFTDELRKLQWGSQIGAEWKALKHFTVNTNLTWGFNDIFRKDFQTITFAMYPIYLNIGFGYVF